MILAALLPHGFLCRIHVLVLRGCFLSLFWPSTRLGDGMWRGVRTVDPAAPLIVVRHGSRLLTQHPLTCGGGLTKKRPACLTSSALSEAYPARDAGRGASGCRSAATIQ